MKKRQQQVRTVLLQTHVFRAYGQLLLACARHLQQRPSRRNVEAASEALQEVADMMFVLQGAFTNVGWQSSAMKVRELDLLAAELHESSIQEAWATCCLHLAACEDSGSFQMAKALGAFFKYVPFLDMLLRDRPGAVTLCAATPALQYLLTNHMAQVLAVLDGGTTYGLPAEAPQVPVFNTQCSVLRGPGNGSSVVDTCCVFFAIERYRSQLQEMEAAAAAGRRPTSASSSGQEQEPNARALAALPPLRLEVMFELSLRVARAAVATWEAHLEDAEGLPRSSNRPLVDRAQAGLLLRTSLIAAEKVLVYNRLGLAVSAPWRRSDSKRLESLWSVYTQAICVALSLAQETNNLSPLVGPVDMDEDVALGDAWEDLPGAQPWFESGPMEDLPSEPCAVVRALLASDAIRCNERLMRLKSNNAPLFARPSNWTELLLFGPMDELACLVVSVAKYLRRTVALMCGPPSPLSEQLLLTYIAQQPDAFKRSTQLLRSITWFSIMFNMPVLCTLAPKLQAVFDTGGVAGDGTETAEAASEAEEAWLRVDKLLTLWALAATRLLPAQSLALRFVGQIAAAALRHPQRSELRSIVAGTRPAALFSALNMCYLLLHACARGGAASAAAGSASGGDLAASAAKEWRRVLFHDVDFVGLLAAVPVLLAAGLPAEPPLGRRLRGLLQLACAVLPLEMRAALCGVPMLTAAPRAAALLPLYAEVLGPEGPFPDAELLQELQRVAQGLPGSPAARVTQDVECAAVAAMLPYPWELRERLPIEFCANPCCRNMEEDSEEDLGLFKCVRCDRFYYCSEQCQEAHWLAGHKEDCA